MTELQKSDNWFGDGTFKSVLSTFSQLYTIHCHKKKSVLPLVNVLMADRTKNTCTEVFNQLLTYYISPILIQSQFEPAFISTFKDIFFNAKMNGCFFTFVGVFGVKYNH